MSASRKPRPSIGCGGMIFTLISLVALGVVLSGLYFFSAWGAVSPGAAAELWRLRGMGLRLYLSETTTALAFFFTGTRDGVSSSNPVERNLA